MRLRIGLLLAGLVLAVAATPGAAEPTRPASKQAAAARAASAAALAESKRQLKAARERYLRTADGEAPSGSAPSPGAGGGPSAPGSPGGSDPGGVDTDPPPPPPLPSPGTGARNLQVRAGEFWLSLSKPSVPAGTVKVEFNNTQAEDPHDLHLVREDGSGSAYSFGVLGSGDVQSKSFVLSVGTWSLFCALPEHAERGMTARLAVAGS